MVHVNDKTVHVNNKIVVNNNIEYTKRLATSERIFIRTNYVHKLTHKNIHT